MFKVRTNLKVATFPPDGSECHDGCRPFGDRKKGAAKIEGNITKTEGGIGGKCRMICYNLSFASIIS